MDLAYFDSSVFLSIFNGEDSASAIKARLRELKNDGCKVCTSIITIQEVSVLSFQSNVPPLENYSRVDRLCRIHGINRDIAVLAAKLEHEILQRMKSKTRDERREMNPRRKWDCFHIATALHMRCRWLYSLDPGLLACKALVESAASITFAKPEPVKMDLGFAAQKGFRVQ